MKLRLEKPHSAPAYLVTLVVYIACVVLPLSLAVWAYHVLWVPFAQVDSRTASASPGAGPAPAANSAAAIPDAPTAQPVQANPAAGGEVGAPTQRPATYQPVEK